MIRIGNLLIRPYEITAIKYEEDHDFIDIYVGNNGTRQILETVIFDTPEQAKEAFDKLVDDLMPKPLEYEAKDAEESMPSLSKKVENLDAKLENIKVDFKHTLERWDNVIEDIHKKIDTSFKFADNHRLYANKRFYDVSKEFEEKIDILHKQYKELFDKEVKNNNLIKDLFLSMPDINSLEKRVLEVMPNFYTDFCTFKEETNARINSCEIKLEEAKEKIKFDLHNIALMARNG